MTQVFTGLRVVEFSQGMAGSLATMIMADNGAEVIKVEPPDGDYSRQSPGFLMWNRGKKSVVLDLTHGEGRRQAFDLALTADVVLETFRPGQAQEWGLDYGTLAAHRPDLVYCSITGFGLADGYEHLEPRDEIVTAKSGRVCGNNKLSGAHFTDRPIFITSPSTTFGTVGLAVEGITAALFVRGRTGKGQRVLTSLLDGASVATMRLAYKREGNKVVPMRTRASALVKAGIMLCFMTAKCKNGRYIQMCARQDQHFRNWLNALGLGHVFEEDRYKNAPLGFKTLEDIDELDKIIREQMATKTQDEWIDIFTTRWDVGADPFLTPEEFLKHPQMTLNDRISKVEDLRWGTVTQLGTLALFSDTPSRISSSAPTLGQHQLELPNLLAHRAKLSATPPIPANPISEAVTTKPPFDGVTILELAYFLATPLGPTLMAELGARVIKIEPITGDPYRRAGLETVQLLNGKESLPVDLKQKEGQEILQRVLRISDALVHSFRPGVPERLGVDYSTVSQINPNLVYVYGASYGSNGPQKHRPAFHSTPHALNGGGILQGGIGNPPVDDSYPDPCSGIGVAMALAMGLYVREQTGKGQFIETTMLNTAGYVHSERLTHYQGMPQLPMLDSGQYGLGALNRLYQARNGWLMLSAIRPVEWERLARVLGHSEWLSDARFATPAKRWENDGALVEELGILFRGEDAQAWETILNDFGVPAAAVATSFPEFMVENGFVEGDEHPSFGTYWRVKPRVRFSTSPNRRGRPSAVGEHTLQLLEELGYSTREINHLVDKKVVVTEAVTA